MAEIPTTTRAGYWEGFRNGVIVAAAVILMALYVAVRVAHG